MGNHQDILDCIISNHLSDMDVSFCKDFIDPFSQAQLNDEFPYITFLLSDFTLRAGSSNCIQTIDVFGFVKSDDEISYKRSELLAETLNKLKKVITFESGSITNLFAPFGLTAFLDKPYGGFRLTGTIGFNIEQAPLNTISAQAVQFLTLAGANFQFLDGSNWQTLS